ncbi:MAG: FtsH protease activity modulator HflK [Alphaproteobacteria bacterium]|nr:FtsH protease activity modulator HflK [Alphaproteobacteria bacterium]
MSDDNEKDRKKRKNPWGDYSEGSREGKGKRQSPWGNHNGGGHRGGGNHGGRGDGPNDLDDFLKNAQDGLREVLPGNMGGGTALLLILLAVLALWLASGFYIINPGEHGVIQRFGAWSRTIDQEGLGYHFPAPVEQMTKVEVTKQQSMNIGLREAISSRMGTTQIRVNDESLMLTADRNIIELNMTIQWDIKSAEDYLFQIEDQEGTIKKVAESAIREVVGQTEMFPVITTGRAQIASKVKDIIQKNLDEYHSGVNVKQVLIDKAEVHPDVQQAFQDVQSAYQIAEETQNLAQAEREKIIPTARGNATQIRQEAEAYKQSKIAQATGDAERFRLIYQAYLGGKDVTKERIYIETMEQVLGNAQKIIMDSKDGGQGVVPYLPLNELKAKKQ